MKRIYSRCLVACMLLLSFVISAQPERYVLDSSHTYVLFHINHLGFSNQSGKWYASGSLILDQNKPENSKVTATINVANIDTGNSELDNHLKGEEFFDVAKYPIATFVSDKIIMTGKNTAKVHGTLTLHGVSKPIILNVTLNKVDTSLITNKMTAGFSASANLKRSDFGITKFLPALGDDVKINIEGEAYKADQDAQDANQKQ